MITVTLGGSAIALAGVALLAACSTPADKITLLPDADGTVGAVIVRSAGGQQTIDKAYGRVNVAKGGTMQASADSQAGVQARYGDLLAARPPAPMTYTINYLFDSATDLAPGSSATVDKMKRVLATWPAPHLVVVGHTDLAGSQEFNDRLSMRRAQSVAAFLVKAGIPAQQIEVAGRGKREPLVVTRDGVANPANRRVVITIQ